MSAAHASLNNATDPSMAIDAPAEAAIDEGLYSRQLCVTT
jgi:hypothetical protein